jgi:cellulose synthase/poly-beta-1,6-N-acetylglucosamine synthase-like glycosyltransferase
MMSTLEICFWCCAGLVAYAYAGYPLLLAVAARLWGRPTRRGEDFTASVSIVLAAHNEEQTIGRRLRELCDLIADSGLRGEVVVVSDGSTDGTAVLARNFTKGPVRVLELPAKGGKAAALSAGCAAAAHDILVFADSRQTWSATALRLLLENFADPTVGAVSGDLVVENAPGVLAGVGLYWRYEKWLRKAEGRIHSTVGVTGAISAVRRPLFRPIPDGTILDDVYWPLQVVLQGHRVVHDQRACAHDRLPERARDEFRRKVRTLSGNFQLVQRLPALLLPWRNPVWFQLLSHKLLRLAAPWALLGMLATSFVLPGPFFQTAFWVQLGGYAFGLLGACTPVGARLRLASVAGSFLVLNAAAWLAFWVWLTGRAARSWAKVSYKTAALGCPANP